MVFTRKFTSIFKSEYKIPPLILQNKNIHLCPSCGNPMSIDAEFVREDIRFRTKVVERAYSCSVCRIKIRQYIYMY